MNDTSIQADHSGFEVAKRKKWWQSWWFTAPFWVVILSFFCGFETFLLQNIPMLIFVTVIFGGMGLIHQIVVWRFGKPKQRSWKSLVFIGIIMCGWAVWFCGISLFMRFFVPPMPISPETTHVLGPVNKEGFIDVIGAIEDRFAPQGGPEENGYRFLLETFGIDTIYYRANPEKRSFYGESLQKQLEISGNIVPVASYLSPYRFFMEQFEADHEADENPDEELEKLLQNQAYEKVRTLTDKPWDAAAMQEMTDWLETNTPALDLFAKAVRFPDYFAPVVREREDVLLYDLLLYEVQFHRDLVEGVRCRIMFALARGETQLAIEDAVTLLRFSDAGMRHPMSYMHLIIATSMRALAIEALVDLLHYGNLSQEQLFLLRDTWQEYRSRASLSDSVFLARMEAMQTLTGLLSFRDFEDFDTPPRSTADKIGRFLNQPLLHCTVWTPVFKDFQKRFDELDEHAALPPGRAQCDAFQAWKRDPLKDIDFKKMLQQCFWKGKSVAVFLMISDVCIDLTSSHLSWVYAFHRDETRTRLLDLAFALEFYKRDHGTYPVSLDALAEKGRETILIDPFTYDEPFRYRLEESGYLLYGIGSNGVDDNGVSSEDCDCGSSESQNEQTDEPPPTGDDIRIRMS